MISLFNSSFFCRTLTHEPHLWTGSGARQQSPLGSPYDSLTIAFILRNIVEDKDTVTHTYNNANIFILNTYPNGYQFKSSHMYIAVLQVQSCHRSLLPF